MRSTAFATFPAFPRLGCEKLSRAFVCHEQRLRIPQMGRVEGGESGEGGLGGCGYVQIVVQQRSMKSPHNHINYKDN